MMSECYYRYIALAVVLLALCLAISAIEIWTIIIGATNINYMHAVRVIVLATSGLVERIVLGLCLLCFYYRKGETQINDEKYIQLFIKRVLPLACVAVWFKCGWTVYWISTCNSDAYQNEKKNPELSLANSLIGFVEVGWYFLCVIVWMYVCRKAIIHFCRCSKNLDDDVIDVTSQTSPPV